MLRPSRMLGLNGTSLLQAALKSRTVRRNASRIDAVELRRQLLERVGLGLGDAPDAILAAQQMGHLGVEHLPGEHARLLA